MSKILADSTENPASEYACTSARQISKLGELIHTQLMPLLQSDPDAIAIDWDSVEWMKGTEAWVPNFEQSLAENGIRHKQQLRMRTPGLQSLNPAE